VIDLIIDTIWLFLPAGIANMSPVIFKWLPIFNYPVDCNKTFNNKRIFGDHKTYRGLFVGVLMAILTVYIEKQFINNNSLIDYNEINVAFLGFLLGFGALGGDLLKSFFKRQFNVQPGVSWMPFDQIDWILGALLAISLYQCVNWRVWVISLSLGLILHILINIIGYYLGIKKNRL
jgi:CDP-2,3-bis-(O-geranylgeranyl)-sn-glycerol synthase